MHRVVDFVKERADKGRACARADNIARGTLSEYGVDRVNDDTLACARLACEDVEPAVEVNGALLNDGYIFYIQGL